MDPKPRLLRIRASAGSGKTFALTRQYLDLLRQAEASEYAGLACAPRGTLPRPHGWPEILAITFTNRAAMEMKERIIRTLKSMALGLEKDLPRAWTPELAASWLHTILRRFGSLNVRTIDSLLHTVVRLSALELGLAPDFTPVFANEDALAPLLDELLEKSRHDPELREELTEACRNILLHTPATGFMNSGSLRAQVLSLVRIVGVAGRPPSARDLLGRLHALSAEVRAAAAQTASAVLEEKLPLKRYALDCLDFCHAYDGAAPLRDSATFNAPSLEEWLLKSGRGLTAQASERAFARLRLAMDRMNTEGAVLRTALSLLPYAQLAWRVHRSLADYLQGQSTLPADLIPGLAQQVLQSGYGVSEAFCRMGSSLTHLLVDEFQDTSRGQWAALHPLALDALARGGSLTAVGDVKQSIYGWRGGDPQLFNNLPNDPELLRIAETAETDTLPTNWRSREAIVRANNSIFSQLADLAVAKRVMADMLSDNPPGDILEQSVSALCEAYSDAGQLPSGKKGGFVRLEPLAAANAAHSDELVSARVLDLVRDIAARRPLGDISILVRANEFGKHLAHSLLDAGFPVVTENSLLLAEHPAISQCVAFLQWMDAPRDDLAFWTLVSGPGLLLPLPGHSRESLEDWLCGLGGEPLPEAFRRDFSEVWQAWLAPFHNQSGLLSAYDAVREMLRVWQVWERLPEEGTFLQRFLEVLHLAEQQGCISVSSFLVYWGEHGQEEKAPMPDSLDAVRIMTIHAAKGLQFPVVIVPEHAFLTVSSGRADPPAVVELDGMTVVARRSPVLRERFFSAQAELARESLNLLYVAWTRAEDELYALLNSYPSVNGKPGLARALPCLLERLPDAWTRHDDGCLTLGLPPAAHETLRPEAPPAPPVREAPARNLTPGWLPMDWLPRLRVFRNEPDALLFSARRRGTFTHACLEYVADFLRGLDGAPDDVTALRPHIDEAIRACRRLFPMVVPEDALPEVAENLLWFFSQPDSIRLVRAGAAEQPLLDANGAVHRPDLLCAEYADGEIRSWTVLEYKTGQPTDEHAAQLGRYLKLVEAVSGCPACGKLVYLDQRLIHSVPPPDSRGRE